VRADRSAFLDDTDRDLAIRSARQLRKPTRRREARGPGTDHDDIELHTFA
jgi:hypothetical protein